MKYGSIPRVAKDGIAQSDLMAQESLSLQVRDALSNARRAAYKIQTIHEEDKKLAEIRDLLVTKEGRYQTPMLIDQLSYLFSMLDRADQKPGRDAYQRFDELNITLSGYLSELQNILDNDREMKWRA